MSNAAQIDDLWEGSAVSAPPRPYMDTNRWLQAVIPTKRRQRKAPEPQEFEVLGVKATWTPDASGEFPEPVFERLEKLIEFAALDDGWDSYAGVSLKQAAIKPALQIIFCSYQRACDPRLYPLPDGGVGFRWANGLRELEIDVAGTGELEGLFVNGETDEEVELPFGSPSAEVMGLFEKYSLNR